MTDNPTGQPEPAAHSNAAQANAGQQSNEPVRVSLDDGLMTVQFNRPESLNAVTPDTVTALEAAVDRAAAGDVRALILTGNERAFSSGADIRSNSDGKGVGLDVVNRIMGKIAALPVPTVAAVSGPAAGVGCSFALICDYVVMSENSYLMLAFTKIGLMPDGGATALVAASAGRHRAMRMALTAEKVPAATALEWGLASEVTPASDYLERAHTVARAFAAGPTRSLGLTKVAINQASLPQLADALQTEFDGQEQLRASADFMEGVTAFREKRPAQFTGK